MLQASGAMYIAATIALTVYGQLVLKWRLDSIAPTLEGNMMSILRSLFSVVSDPFVLSGLAAAFLASLTWIMALNKQDLSIAYPFMSLNFVFVVAFSILLFGEAFTFQKVIGVSLIVIGTVIAVR